MANSCSIRTPTITTRDGPRGNLTNLRQIGDQARIKTLYWRPTPSGAPATVAAFQAQLSPARVRHRNRLPLLAAARQARATVGRRIDKPRKRQGKAQQDVNASASLLACPSPNATIYRILFKPREAHRRIHGRLFQLSLTGAVRLFGRHHQRIAAIGCQTFGLWQAELLTHHVGPEHQRHDLVVGVTAAHAFAAHATVRG